MQETIRRCLANVIGKIRSLLIYPSAKHATGYKALARRTLVAFFYPWLHKAQCYVSPAMEKRNRSRLALISLHFVLILMSFCISLLLTIALLGATNNLAIAVQQQ